MLNFNSKLTSSACKKIVQRQAISTTTLYNTKITFFSKCLEQNDKRTQNKFLKFSNKNYLGYKSKKTPFDVNYTSKPKSKNIEWFEVNEPLVFQNGKMTIVQASNSEKLLLKRLRLYVALPILILSSYKFAMALLSLRLGGSFIWGLITTLSYRIFSGLNQNKYFIIYHIELLEDGKQIIMTGESGSTTYDINDIRRLSPEETAYVLEMLPDSYYTYIPIVVKDEIFLILKNSKFYDAEMFKAICSGNYVRMKSAINKDNAIDIGEDQK
jgi:hypothetical protein